MARLSFRCDEGLVKAVDEARGDIARERWLRRAVEQALGDDLQRGGSDPLVVAASPSDGNARVRIPPPGRMAGGSSVGRAPEDGEAPAEQPQAEVALLSVKEQEQIRRAEPSPRPLSRVEAFRRATQR